MQLPRPQSVTPIADYKLDIGFNNGELKRLDMTPYLVYPAFAALREVSLFMQAKVAHNTIVWTGEIDIAPESVYLESQLIA
jgi:Protein of unknown function (DUF2442)